MRVLPEASS